MPHFELVLKRDDRAAGPIVQARFGAESAFAIPTTILEIEASVSRLQSDITRNPGTSRGGDDPPDSGTVPPQEDVSPSGRELQQLGSLLFSYLFSGDIENLYREAVRRCDKTEGSLEITLTFSDDDQTNPLRQAPWLNRAPWEALWDNQTRQFLATAGSTFFSRAVGGPLEISPRAGPLRILAMVASPRFYGARQLAPLGGAEELVKIKDALRNTNCEVSCVVGESIDALEDELFENHEQKHFDVFHFIGHGDFDPMRGEGYLLFTEPGGAGGTPIYADDLRDRLTDPWAPQLVVLNSCSGAQSLSGDIFSSTAAFLSLGRIPAVVAMQFPITDGAARAFSRSFYRWLGKGATVQDATRRARRSLKDYGPEWITPVLYLRNRDGHLVVREGGIAPT